MRTELQHLWAELSEKFADVTDPAFKYGGGDEGMQRSLANFSSLIANIETQAESLRRLKGEEEKLKDNLKQELAALLEGHEAFRAEMQQGLRELISGVERLKGGGE